MTTEKLSRPVLRNSSLFGSSPLVSLFDEFFNSVASPSFANFVPSVNISENEKEFLLEFSAPGFSKEQFKVNLENDLLTVSGEYKREESVTEKNYSRREFNLGSFKRSFSLPDTVDKDGVTARYENGILFISIPKKVEAIESNVKQIEIK